MGAEGQEEKCGGHRVKGEKWKAVRGFWDGSSKRDGKSGCGVIIKGVDRDIIKIAVPLCFCTAMTAEGILTASWVVDGETLGGTEQKPLRLEMSQPDDVLALAPTGVQTSSDESCGMGRKENPL